MQSRKDWQEDLFVASPLRELVPDDHILKRVDAILDLSWLHEAVRECYCQDNGRPSIDPEAALRLMLAGFFQGIVHDRKLMREAQVNLAIRWFTGYRLDESLPERSSLTRIRQRWGADLFRRIFERTVAQCVAAGLVSADTVHIDATLIRADVSWDSLTTRHVEQVVASNVEKTNESDDDEPATRGPGRPRTKKAKTQKYSPTDPDATMSTSCKQYHLEPTYKQHTAVEDKNGVVVDVSVTTGQANEGKQLIEQVERIDETLGAHVACVTCDAGYAHGANYAALEDRETDGIIPPQRTPRRKLQRIPARRFKYDEHKDRITCPTGKYLEPKRRASTGNGQYYRAHPSDCKHCPLRARCLSPSGKTRTILLGNGYTALLRARRRKEKGWDDQIREKYTRHRWQVEGAHGRAKTQHGLARATGRGIDNVSIQVYLTASVMNLKKLISIQSIQDALLDAVKHLTAPMRRSWALWSQKRLTNINEWTNHFLQPIRMSQSQS
jgi:transposase